ncbi:MAG: hypothetical protein KDB37_11180 [Ilumatobacter sp.]|nr:hypothetical protein [Ilumatobacter sp.]
MSAIDSTTDLSVEVARLRAEVDQLKALVGGLFGAGATGQDNPLLEGCHDSGEALRMHIARWIGWPEDAYALGELEWDVDDD